jgi:hypothetical protein
MTLTEIIQDLEVQIAFWRIEREKTRSLTRMIEIERHIETLTDAIDTLSEGE